jgi:RimJ/RimL family protein N-acetyltransferase
MLHKTVIPSLNVNNIGMEHKTYTLNDGREVHLRSLQPSDREQVVQLYRSMSDSALRWTKAPTGEQIEQIIRYPDYYISLVTEHNYTIIGHGEIKKDSEKRNGELNIHLHQDYHGVGLGTVMMIALMSEANEQSLHGINLQVAAENRKAVSLFRKFGFQQQGTVKETSRGVEHDAYLMSKVLKV